MEHARKLKIPAVNFWSWDYAGSPEGKDFWDVIAAFDWPVSNPLRDMTDILVDALNARDIEKVTDLYQENAVLITSRDTFFGKTKIRSHYTTLLRDLPGATFVLETRVTEGSIRHIKWDARNASNGKSVDNAQDTIGLRQGKIQYHSTVYRIE